MTNALNDILVSGTDYLAAHPDFKFAGRDKELGGLKEILLQKSNNCVVLTGASGVGMTALVMGLQLAKDSPAAPPKMISKPIYFLDVDRLFESGEPVQINKLFRGVRERLSLVPGSILYIENMGNFIDSCTKCGCANLMNGLLGDVKKSKYQTILETPYEDLAKVIKYNSEMKASYTLRDLKEPKGENLDAIVTAAVPALEKHHGIPVSGEAIALATKLASKHRTAVLQALPAGIITLIDRALSSYALKAHSEPLQLAALEARLKNLNEVLENKTHSDLPREEILSRKTAAESEIQKFKTSWEKRQAELVTAHTRQHTIQQRIAKLETRLAEYEAQGQKDGQTVGAAPEAVKAEEDLITAREALETESKKFEAITVVVNKELSLGEVPVLETFSDITGIPVKKLTQSDREKIKGLEERLNNRVFDQTHAVRKVYNAVKNAATGQSEEGKPKGCFLFLGPSGVGKTELVKAVCDDLFDDPNALVRIDMSEYMEKTAANKLIGPPPGYVGFEEGGYLTEAMQKRPIRIVLIDEIEKAHPDVLNLFLQALDDGRLTDGKGVTVSFEDVYFFFTSNVGQNNFPDRSVDYDAAMTLSITQLKESGVRNELLNRFAGKRNIVGFYPLEAHTMEKIVQRELEKVNKKLAATQLKVDISPGDVTRIGHDLYSPSNGARSVPGFFNDEVRPKASDILLDTPNAKGVIKLVYDQKGQKMDLVSYTPHAPAPEPASAPTGLKTEMRRAAHGQPDPSSPHPGH